MSKEKIVVVKGTFNNIYFWGKGYRDLETANAWHNAWDEVKSILWHHTRLDDTEYLVNIQGSIYLHPMDFRAILHGCGCHTSDTYDCAELKKLQKSVVVHLTWKCQKKLQSMQTLYHTQTVFTIHFHTNFQFRIY